MSVQQPQNVSYGLNQALINNSPTPIASKRNPAANDYAAVGTIWCDVLTNEVFILASIVANVATWVEVAAGGGAGIFASLTVNPGPTNLTGTTNINTVGAGVTHIGTGGTGAVTIGNATGGTQFTGLTTLAAFNATGTANINTAGAAVTSIGVGGTGAVNLGNATGNVHVSAGDVVLATGSVVLQGATAGYIFSNGVVILAGSGDPNGNLLFAAPVGSLYLNHTGSGVADRAFLNTDGNTVWTAISTVA